jgi:exopolysaccharide biosynthesis polyprenyl glycosylphosphotransferase
LKKKNQHIASFIILDFILSFISWYIFWFFRKNYIEQVPILEITYREFLIPFTISVGWVMLYAIFGIYQEPIKTSRLKVIGLQIQATLLGVIAIFFVTLLDDPIPGYSSYRYMVFVYFILQFFLVAISRFLLATRYKHKLYNGTIGYNTVIIGNGEAAEEIFNKLTNMKPSAGYHIVGYISILPPKEGNLHGKLKRLGELKDLHDILQKRNIEEVIICTEVHQSKDLLLPIISECSKFNVTLNVVPGLYDYLVGNVKMSNVLDAPLVKIKPHIIAPWESVVKRAMDITVSILALIVLLPVYIIIAILIKLDSKGPVFYLQERIGKGGKPFKIIKFRSMYVNAESNGPCLSSKDDPRITRIGKFLRKTRLDEFPQFINVLKGDMSLVGPRPERQYFIDQIVKIAPHYVHLHRVKPGITSWGQVKYGYAENVQQMVERLEYDLLYIENMSLAMDIKILAYTILIILQGRGK